MQENNVHRNICPGIGPEGGVRQADRAQQVTAPGHILSGVRVLFVHCAAADAIGSDESDDAACPHLVDGLGKEVIVDQQVVPVIGAVTHPVVAKRYISDGKVKDAIRVLRFLKAVDLDAGIGIEMAGDAPGDAVQLHAVQLAFAHALREHPEEVAHAAGRFQNVSAVKAHLLHGLINGADHHRAGVVGVQGGGSGRLVFLRGQKLLQFGILLCPGSFGRVESLRHAAPAHIAGKDFLLVRAGLPARRLKLLQQPDGGDIGLIFEPRSAFPQVVIRDAEVLRVPAGLVRVSLMASLLRRRGRFRRCGFRLVYVQPLHHHIIGKSVFVPRIDRYRLGGDFRRRGFFFLRRKQSGVSLILAQPGFKLFPADDIIAPGIRPGVNADCCIFDGINRAGDGVVGRGERHMVAHLVRWSPFQGGGVPVCEAFRVLKEAVQLLYIHSPKKRSQFIPSVCQGRKFSFLMVQDLHLNAGGEGAVVRYVAGHKVHRLHTTGIQFGKTLGDSGVALAIPQPAGNILFVLPGKQAGSQHFPQVLVRFLRVGKKELGNGAVSQVVFQKLLEPFPAFGPEDGVSHAGRKKLYRILPQLRDLVFLIFQIDRISLMVDRRGWVIDLFLRDSLLDGLVFFIGNGNVNLMGRLPVPDGDGVSLAGDGLAG